MKVSPASRSLLVGPFWRRLPASDPPAALPRSPNQRSPASPAPNGADSAKHHLPMASPVPGPRMSNIRTIGPGLVQRLALCLHEGAYICKSLGIVGRALNFCGLFVEGRMGRVIPTPSDAQCSAITSTNAASIVRSDSEGARPPTQRPTPSTRRHALNSECNGNGRWQRRRNTAKDQALAKPDRRHDVVSRGCGRYGRRHEHSHAAVACYQSAGRGDGNG